LKNRYFGFRVTSTKKAHFQIWDFFFRSHTSIEIPMGVSGENFTQQALLGSRKLAIIIHIDTAEIKLEQVDFEAMFDADLKEERSNQ